MKAMTGKRDNDTSVSEKDDGCENDHGGEIPMELYA